MSRLLQAFLSTIILLGYTSADQCVLPFGNYEAAFGSLNGTVYFRLSIAIPNPAASNGWTAIGFGQSMRSGIDVIIVRVLNGRVLVTDEFVQGYTRPTPDRINHVQMGSVNFSNGVLKVSFSRPAMTFDQMDHPLNGCSTWQFVTAFSPVSPQGALFHHSRTPVSRTVCLQQCLIR